MSVFIFKARVDDGKNVLTLTPPQIVSPLWLYAPRLCIKFYLFIYFYLKKKTEGFSWRTLYWICVEIVIYANFFPCLNLDHLYYCYYCCCCSCCCISSSCQTNTATMVAAAATGFMNLISCDLCMLRFTVSKSNQDSFWGEKKSVS